MAQRKGASRGGARGGGVACAMRGGGVVVREAIPTVAGLTGIDNRGGGGGVPRREGKEAPQKGDRVQEESKGLVGASVGGGSSCWAEKPAARGGSGALCFSVNRDGRRTVGGLFCNFQKIQGLN